MPTLQGHTAKSVPLGTESFHVGSHGQEGHLLEPLRLRVHSTPSEVESLAPVEALDTVLGSALMLTFNPPVLWTVGILLRNVVAPIHRLDIPIRPLTW